jgi:hypothetical protein
MAFLEGMKTLVNVAADVGGHRFPDVGERLVRAGDSAACVSCPKYEAHGKPCNAVAALMLFGDRREDLVPSANVIDTEFLRAMNSYAFRAGYVANGLPDSNTLYNLGLGQATNVVDSVRYEILGIATNTRLLQLRGPDPRSVGFLVSRVNPDWLPLPADEQTEPRLLIDGAASRIGAGCSVLFEFPSVLFKRLNPYIEYIWPPSGPVAEGDTTFTVQLSHRASYARTPWDLAFPPDDDRYFLRIVSYFAAPEAYPDFQPSPEKLFTPVTREYVVPDDVDENRIYLLDDAGFEMQALLKYPQPLARAIGTDAEGNKRLVNAQLAVRDIDVNQWRSHLQFAAGALDGLVSVEISYIAAASSISTNLFPAAARCRHSVHTPDGNGDDDGFSCERTECSKYQAGKFGGSQCYDTAADRFELPEKGDDPSGRSLSATRFWQAEPLVLRQGGPGSEQGTAASSHRNFAFDRNGGVPSIGSICGGFFWQDLVGVGERRTSSFFGPRHGKRVEFTDNDGRPWHRLSHGMFGNDDGGVPIFGATGWEGRPDPRGNIVTNEARIWPTHRGPSCGLAGFDLSSDPAPGIRIARDPERLIATDRDDDGVDQQVLARIGRYT